jgi:hypothetical protein
MPLAKRIQSRSEPTASLTLLILSRWPWAVAVQITWLCRQCILHDICALGLRYKVLRPGSNDVNI